MEAGSNPARGAKQARIAQSIVHLTCNEKVVGLNPTLSTNLVNKRLSMFYVMRTYSSHIAQTQLIKVCSRAINTRESAEDWKEFCASEEKNKKHEFFIMESKEYI
jgi:hypothetical protein